MSVVRPEKKICLLSLIIIQNTVNDGIFEKNTFLTLFNVTFLLAFQSVYSELAIQDYSRAISLDPNNPELYERRAEVGDYFVL